MTRQIISLSFVLFPLSSAFGQQDCVLRKDKDSVKVYTCHSAESKFKSIKASFTVNSSFSQLAAMVLDIEQYSLWQYNTINPVILTRLNEHEVIYNAEVVAPWPVSNRDLVIHLKVGQNLQTKSIIITANSIPDYIPKKENSVRIPMSQSQWIVTKISGTKLQVEYSMKIDPGGSIPAWLVNMVCAEAPYETFKNLRSRMQLQKDKFTGLPFIED